MRLTYIDDTIPAGRETGLHELIILAQVPGIQAAAKLVVDQVLPANRKTEHIHAVILGEVLHLTGSATTG